MEGSGVVEEIFLSPLTTIAALFRLIASDIYGKMFLASFSVTDLIAFVTVCMGGHHFLGHQKFQPFWSQIF